MNRTTRGSSSSTALAALLSALLILASSGLTAQQRMKNQRKDRVDRVERLKQMKLIEDLQLGEEESVRFMAKRKEHEDRMRDMEEERGKILDGLVINLEDKAGDDKIKAGCDRVLETDRLMFEERKRYQDEMRTFLSPVKYAKLLIFERNFQSQVRDAMRRSIRSGKSKYDR